PEAGERAFRGAVGNGEAAHLRVARKGVLIFLGRVPLLGKRKRAPTDCGGCGHDSRPQRVVVEAACVAMARNRMEGTRAALKTKPREVGVTKKPSALAAASSLGGSTLAMRKSSRA